MKLLYIADGRSPIALSWIKYFIQGGNEVHLASTYPCQTIDGITSLRIIPVAMSDSYGQPEGGNASKSLARQLLPVSVRTKMRQLLAPWTFPQAARILRQCIADIQPELVHAMRIPFEGMVAAMAMRRGNAGRSEPHPPLIVSVWGNDFTLHAKSTPGMEYFTRQTLQVCDALHTDCQRDLKLAYELGYPKTKPSIVLPGGGGIKLEVFYPCTPGQKEAEDQNTPIWIVNPRGIRAYVRNDTFFRAIPWVLKKYPQVQFICPGMADEPQARKWVQKTGMGKNIQLLPVQSPQQMADIFRQSRISLSITTHDGTPNTLLEAMACGCFPIAGDLESIREWITSGENGLLVDPGDEKEVAGAMIRAISEPDLRWRAREHNLALVRERGEYVKSTHAAEEFYQMVISIEA